MCVISHTFLKNSSRLHCMLSGADSRLQYASTRSASFLLFFKEPLQYLSCHLLIGGFSRGRGRLVAYVS